MSTSSESSESSTSEYEEDEYEYEYEYCVTDEHRTPRPGAYGIRRRLAAARCPTP